MTDIAPLSTGVAGRVSEASSAVLEPVAQTGVGRVERGSDRVDLSELARRLASVPQDIRADKVQAAREKIDAGVMDTPQNLEAALGAMIDDLELTP